MYANKGDLEVVERVKSTLKLGDGLGAKWTRGSIVSTSNRLGSRLPSRRFPIPRCWMQLNQNTPNALGENISWWPVDSEVDWRVDDQVETASGAIESKVVFQWADSVICLRVAEEQQLSLITWEKKTGKQVLNQRLDRLPSRRWLAIS